MQEARQKEEAVRRDRKRRKHVIGEKQLEVQETQEVCQRGEAVGGTGNARSMSEGRSS